MSEQYIREPAEHLSFEKVWAMFQETDRKFKETDKQFKEIGERFKETDKKFQETDKKFQETDKESKKTWQTLREASRIVGNLGNKLGIENPVERGPCGRAP
jgi:uncharacterized protein HemX